MKLETVAIHSPGEMGEATGRVLKAHGLRVVAALAGRSERTRGLAAAAGIEDVGSLENLAREADMVLSILVPARAQEAAREIAAAMGAAGHAPLYVDCNAISPANTAQVAELVGAAGARFVDASIIGPPPRKPGVTRFYASGPAAEDFAQLAGHGLDVRVVGPEVGQASGLKMCYAGLTKGLQAMSAEVLVAARLMGLSAQLQAELETSQQVLLGWISRSMPSMPPKAHRFVGEMEEIAATYEQLGLTPRIELGAADMYRAVATTALGKESPEERDPGRTFLDVADALANDLRRE